MTAMEGVRRRMSALEAATQAMTKLTQSDPIPQEDHDFIARHPTWEDQLPPIHGVSKAAPDRDRAASSSSSAALIAALAPAIPDSPATKNWKRAYTAIKRLMNIRRKARRTAVGTGARMEGTALGIWSLYSPSRLYIFRLLYNQRAEYVVVFLICSHMVVLIFQAMAGSRHERWTHVRSFNIDFLDGLITALYTIEMVLRISALGFINGRHCYMRNPYNRLDFVIVFDSWVHIIARGVTGHDFFARIAVFRVFRGLLALKHVTFFADVIAIMAAVKKSVGPLQNVILLTFFLLVFYSLLGTQFLQNSMNQRCFRTADKQLAYPMRFCDKKAAGGYVCPPFQNCMTYENPNHGATTFDYLWYSLLTMFQVITLEGWSLVMQDVKDAEGERANSYFMTLIVLGTYFLANVFIAGISGVFLRVRSEHQALLRKARRTSVSFYDATMMAQVLKDNIVKADSHMPWYNRLLNRSRKVQQNVARALSRTRTSLRTALQARSMRVRSSRSFSRSMTIGVQAALTVSEKSRDIVEHPKFEWGVLLSVTINVVLLSSFKYGMSKRLLHMLDGLQAVMLFAFSGELLLRFLAYGPGDFLDDGMNLLDLIVVLTSIVALSSHSFPNLTSIRIMRWFYSSKKYVAKHPSVVATCMESVGSLAGVFFFFLLVIIVISIISMELYSGQYYSFPEEYPRGNHDSILEAMLVWFTVTTAESWVNQMWNSLRPGVQYNVVAPFLYVFYFVVTVYVVMNLIIAVLLERNELTDNQKKRIQRMEHMKLIRRMQSQALTRSGSWVVGAVEGMKGLRRMTTRMLSVKDHVKPVKARPREKGSQGRQRPAVTAAKADGGTTGSALEAPSSVVPAAESSEAPPSRHRRSSQVLQVSGFPSNIGERRGSRTALQDAVITLDKILSSPKIGRNLSRASSNRKSFQLSEYEELERTLTTIQRPWYLREGSLLLFGEGNTIRILSRKILGSKPYLWFVIVWMVINTWLVVEMGDDGEPIIVPDFIWSLQKINFVVFLVDCLMKIVAQGLIFAPDAYLSDWYNILDLFILVTDALILVKYNAENETSIPTVGAFTSLRPFRFVVRFTGLRSLLSNLFRTIPAIVSVILFTFSILLIFGTIGLQQFRGLLWKCNDPRITHRAYCTGLYVNDIGILAPRAWVNNVFHFDDIQNALLSMFVCSTFDNWLTHFMYPVMDITGEDHQPVRNASPVNALFFVAFCCIGGFYIVRVFIGVFINEFGKNSGAVLLTERQKLWRDMNRIIQKTYAIPLARRPSNPIRGMCFYLIRNPTYQKCMILALLGYSGLLATNYAGQSAVVSDRRQMAHCAITTYFLLESVMKFLGDEWKVYKNEVARQMEFGLSIMAAIGFMGKKGTVRGYVGRTAYIARVFCIIPHVARARVIMRTMFICLPTVAEILALLAIFMYMFAGMAFQLFSAMKEGTCIGPSVNFRTFVNAFIAVFQVTTLDNWSCVMMDTTIDAPACTNGKTLLGDDCGYPEGGIIFFAFLVLVGSHIFMNLFVAVILDAVTFGLVNENSMVMPEHLLAYRNLWSQEPFDPNATGYIGMHKLRRFVNALGDPLGRRYKYATQWYMRIEYEVMSFRVPNKGIPFKELLETLTLYKIGPTGLPLTLRIEREKRIQAVYIQGAATKMQALVRGFLARIRAGKGGAAVSKTEVAAQQELESTRSKPEVVEIARDVRGEALLVGE
ncbi:voltage-dependent L-type calcium channel subunit alpha-1F-like isoform X1 [Selaginella moellendorffii]|uniref:voltage-dependent L-type calcium channel subunit alpha-1F-like isoform X1 n=2 Tax=Selaginella moellendorffii TaxID=88036 RepID=UPI000D1CADC5|nr:voltage-dependent L-type calcium channel subunit alpha-1F-like isoform X1 [Selaginella moellendorffii]|eukprot:XP_024544215.1 voltage-dependent L-type calcium channel subunit alpha-1F-like isoform X1 [Selaginella moellendorffii]